MQNVSDEIYKNHEGTVMVSGKSEVGKVARYITHLLQKDVTLIEVFFIGANAGQQACKACAVASVIADEELEYKLAFTTARAKTQTEVRNIAGESVKEDGKLVYAVKDAFIWRVIKLP